MKTITVKAGDIVVSDFGIYQHWSLVSDTFCEKGLPMLISATKRNGTVKEEPWHVVTQGKHTYPVKDTYERSVNEVLELARSQIDTWKYSLSERNCEHFTKWATGIKVSSTQVVAGVSGAALGASLVGLCSENPKFAKFLGGALLVGGLAVLGAKAIERK
ncbi:lecithin retinol acyltransferase family protein [Vibrio aestuarianus]|uniref:LRAT domain-containing protein n=1 Tax=Vibrio aestuarianus TaxID=28171 RepID=A0ABM9FL00_9VIBR|nr:lecithin retinol acyltransferase family protein [Vibrio aestuarianus]MDE1229188.1 lecithin retinol acyltransferase family protein [Vibrio aestuarianus]MDE1255254.1 lecithin retinol acyltransferase family protein [Vibrio aestuarianus]MDE1273324.1 lecithin retinol acyltransferase family protein [Vibrio aestuarianus]MDE1308931.1 lecithin retinol acyltransferase family protein [Vibrio aestuarianus]MDH5893372.1 lecithin retinol acyltransferase family protein [Vibrio aestuarianus]